jgi:hypothetical protein
MSRANFGIAAKIASIASMLGAPSSGAPSARSLATGVT